MIIDAAPDSLFVVKVMSKKLSRKQRRAQEKRLKAKLKAGQIRCTPETKIGQGVSGNPPLPDLKVPISVVMIVKDCAESLGKTLESLRRQFLTKIDELVVVDTGCADDGATVRTALDFGARVVDAKHLVQDLRPYAQKWFPEFLPDIEKSRLAKGSILDFSEARRISTEAAKNDVVFWIDADDILAEQEPGKLRVTADRLFSEERGDALFMEYVYCTDAQDGAVTTTLKRERIFDRRTYYWAGRCHETAIPREGAKPKGAAYFHDLHSVIQHIREKTPEGPNPSDLRNYIIIRREIEESVEAGRDPDPRSIFYLGNAARGLKRDVEALDLYRKFFNISGSRDDRFAAAYYCAIIFLGERVRRPLDAIDELQKCLKIKPEDPRAPFGLSRAYFQLGRHNEALHWYKVGRMLPEPTYSLHSYDPTHVKVLPLQIAALASEKIDDEQGAVQLTEKLRQIRPNHSDTQNLVNHIGNWVAGKRLVDSVRRLMANSPEKDKLKAGRKIIENLADVPVELEDKGIAKLEVVDERPGRDINIFCGKAPEPWGPKTAPLGLGGSEKSVVQMAPRLQKRGFKVSVYANVPPNQRGIDPETGVNWQHFGAFDRDRDRDTMIYWRAPEMLEYPFPAKRRILWCHDVQSPDRWTPARVALADQVWVLSEYHASTLGKIRDQLGSKLIITRNGIDVDLVKKYYGKVDRNPKKIVFASSPDRGVFSAIRVFQKANIPDSELHIFYGFTKMYMDFANQCEYRSIPDVNRDISAWDYMQLVHTAVDADDRIKWRGRVSWDEMAKELCSAGVWLYPTRFWEISCMIAMESQACGCFPVCSSKAALKETVFSGHNIDPDNIDEASLVLQGACTGNFDRHAMHEEACKRFDYEALADEWAELLK